MNGIQVEYLCRVAWKREGPLEDPFTPVSVILHGLEVSVQPVFCFYFLCMDHWLFTIKPKRCAPEDVLSLVKACFN